LLCFLQTMHKSNKKLQQKTRNFSLGITITDLVSLKTTTTIHVTHPHYRGHYKKSSCVHFRLYLPSVNKVNKGHLLIALGKISQGVRIPGVTLPVQPFTLRAQRWQNLLLNRTFCNDNIMPRRHQQINCCSTFVKTAISFVGCTDYLSFITEVCGVDRNRSSVSGIRRNLWIFFGVECFHWYILVMCGSYRVSVRINSLIPTQELSGTKLYGC